ncbi:MULTISPECIES: GerAB/ArcD/ProY family transporter [Shouchella]|uniref:GerAB/ArcD/ProY family transporter n=2 Tax=Shouchella TaxID=2893057 RepID=A0ABY7W3Q7_9BACI|nr:MULTISPECIES: GerAB/ArcD/ProY family transporter [Shouchella]MED4126895.1 GerAB/ArcD/ProY family transporter [Shouchella miscanthi]WDF02532.1 GerAB/ArcD/ProY family transporter [Shouchella hunanensis]
MNIKNHQVSSFFALFLVFFMQIGVGIFTFQKSIAGIVGNDGWIAIMFSAASVLVVIRLIYYIMDDGMTIADIHTRFFGKYVGKIVDVFFILYFCLFASTIVVIYVDMVIIWVFPDMYHGILIFIMLALALLFTRSGFRTIMGLSVLTIFMTVPLLLYSNYPQGLLQVHNLTPVWNHSIRDVMSASREMTFQFLGFEVLLVAFPFIKNAKHSAKWAQLGVILSMCVYLFTYILVYLVFTENHLVNIIWPTLSVWRMEYLGISIWLLILLPNICMYLWAASYLGKRTIGWKQKHWLLVLVILVFTSALLGRRFFSLTEVQHVINELGFYTLYFYIPFLAVLTFIFKKRMRRHAKKKHT